MYGLEGAEAGVEWGSATHQCLWQRKGCGPARAGKPPAPTNREAGVLERYKAIVRAHTVFVGKLMHSCPIVSA